MKIVLKMFRCFIIKLIRVLSAFLYVVWFIFLVRRVGILSPDIPVELVSEKNTFAT